MSGEIGIFGPGNPAPTRSHSHFSVAENASGGVGAFGHRPTFVSSR